MCIRDRITCVYGEQVPAGRGGPKIRSVSVISSVSASTVSPSGQGCSARPIDEPDDNRPASAFRHDNYRRQVMRRGGDGSSPDAYDVCCVRRCLAGRQAGQTAAVSEGGTAKQAPTFVAAAAAAATARRRRRRRRRDDLLEMAQRQRPLAH